MITLSQVWGYLNSPAFITPLPTSVIDHATMSCTEFSDPLSFHQEASTWEVSGSPTMDFPLVIDILSPCTMEADWQGPGVTSMDDYSSHEIDFGCAFTDFE